jgi:hypothetical protein
MPVVWPAASIFYPEDGGTMLVNIYHYMLSNKIILFTQQCVHVSFRRHLQIVDCSHVSGGTSVPPPLGDINGPNPAG